MATRTAPLALLAVAACFVDIGSGGSNSDESSTGASTGLPPATTVTSSASAATGDTSQGPPTTATDTSGSVDPTTGQGPTTPTTLTTDPTDPTDPTTLTTDPTNDPTNPTNPTNDPTDPSTSTNTTDPPPVCGNGVLEAGEQCDDGNLSDSDDCLSTCTPASCGDGIRNQGEADIDCGGPCVGCGPCSLCDSNSDCANGLFCDGGLCNEVHQIAVDYAANCSVDGAFFVPVDAVYAGLWRIQAIGGGGYFLYSDPQTFAWYIDCDNFDFTGLNVPQAYPSPGEAFNAVDPKFNDVPYAGGMTFCGIYDSNCLDNAGGAEVLLYHACN